MRFSHALCKMHLLLSHKLLSKRSPTDPRRLLYPKPHMHTKRVSARFERRKHKAGFPPSFHTYSKQKVLPVIQQHLTLRELSSAAPKEVRLCDKERGVSGKHGEERKPARLFIHTCERHPALPGIQHLHRIEEYQALLVQCLFLLSPTTQLFHRGCYYISLTYCCNTLTACM